LIPLRLNAAEFFYRMSQTQALNHPRKNLWTVIFWAGLLVGTLDISGAIINSLANNGNPKMIFPYIASAVFGKEAFSGGTSMSIIGGLFHYVVAYSFTVFFFLIYPKLHFLSVNRLLTGFLYGIFIWCVMNLIVVPLTQINKFPKWNAKLPIQAGILIVAIGIPLSFIAYWYYKSRSAYELHAVRD
jgi:hypothetical protein